MQVKNYFIKIKLINNKNIKIKKYLIGKYSPLKSILHFDLVEELPKSKEADDQEEEEF